MPAGLRQTNLDADDGLSDASSDSGDDDSDDEDAWDNSDEEEKKKKAKKDKKKQKPSKNDGMMQIDDGMLQLPPADGTNPFTLFRLGN